MRPIVQRGIITINASQQTEFGLAAGKGVDAVGGLVFPSVAIPSATLLVVGAGITTDGSASMDTTVEWGAQALSQTATVANNDNTMLAAVYVLLVPVGDTRNLTISNADPGANQIFAIASYMVGPSLLLGEGDAGGPASPVSLPVNFAAGQSAACYAWGRLAVGDPGPWLTPARTIPQGVDLSDDAFAPGYFSEAFAGPGLLGVVPIRKTLNAPASGRWFGLWGVLS